jgi:hypothetical protein
LKLFDRSAVEFGLIISDGFPVIARSDLRLQLVTGDDAYDPRVD